MIEVSCAIIKDGNKVLIAQRSASMSHPFLWEFPGGKIHPGETPERGLIREIREELSIIVKVEQLLPSVKFDYGDKRIKLIPFVCSIWKGTIQPREHKEVKWIEKEELSDYPFLEADLTIINSMMQRSC